MPVGDIYQVNIEFEYQFNPNTYSWHLQADVVGDEDSVYQNLLDFGGVVLGKLLPLHNPSVNFRCITARQVFPTNSLPQQLLTPSSGNRVCSPPLNHLPGQCSCVVTLYGDVLNPTSFNRGRDFLTGQCAENQIDGVWNNGIGTYLEEVCEFYRQVGNNYVAGVNTFSIGVYSPSRAKPPGDPPPPPIVPYFFPLQHVRGRSLVRTQRRRQPLDKCEAICDQVIGDPVP